LYLDTSALAALYIPEVLSSAVAAAVGAKPPAISALTDVEFAAVVARRTREGTLSAADGARVLEAFDLHVAERRYRHFAVDADTFREARRMLRAGRAPLSTLDALHLAQGALNREPVLTADRQLARAAARLGLKFHLVGA
jgi:predicted nucleic acid-binding protein